MKVAMNYGTLYGLSGIAAYLLFYFLNTDVQSKLPQISGYILLVIFIVMGIKSYRDEDLGGSISYSKALGTGILISIFGGIISAVFTLIFFTYIAPDMAQKLLDTIQQNLGEQGYTEEQIEMSMTYARKTMTPIFLFIFTVIGAAFMGFLFSLIISLFMKKEQNPFQSNLS